MASEAPLLVVVGTPGPLPVHIDRARWPVHVTIASNFRVDRSAEVAIPSLLESSAEGVSSFGVKLGPGDRFGVHADVPVLLAPHPSFDRIHAALADGVMRLPGFVAAEPRHWREGYLPHATLGLAVRVKEGETLPVTTLNLVSLRATSGTRMTTIRLA